MTKEQPDDYWDKLSFVIDGDDGEEEGYRDKLYGVLVEILNRIKKLEGKSHIHKFQLPEYKDRLDKFKDRLDKFTEN